MYENLSQKCWVTVALMGSTLIIYLWGAKDMSDKVCKIIETAGDYNARQRLNSLLGREVLKITPARNSEIWEFNGRLTMNDLAALIACLGGAYVPNRLGERLPAWNYSYPKLVSIRFRSDVIIEAPCGLLECNWNNVSMYGRGSYDMYQLDLLKKEINWLFTHSEKMASPVFFDENVLITWSDAQKSYSCFLYDFIKIVDFSDHKRVAAETAKMEAARARIEAARIEAARIETEQKPMVGTSTSEQPSFSAVGAAHNSMNQGNGSDMVSCKISCALL